MSKPFTPARSISVWFHPVCRALLLIGISILFSGCDKKNNAMTHQELSVLAVVNDEAVTTTDVDFMLERMLQGKAIIQADDRLRKKILDSLIASRAMRQQIKESLSTTEIEKIDQSVKAYEEELYVKAYLQQFVIPEPVTMEMVQQYYENNIADFSGKIIREYEILRAPVINDEKARDYLLSAIPDIITVTNWKEKAKEWKDKYNLHYQQGRSQAGVLNKEIDHAMGSLQEGKTSDVIYIDGELHLVRVIGISKPSPKPLTEVDADIRKRLAAQVLREAVKKASDDARAKAKVDVRMDKIQ